jgi:hypothetical protein
MMKLINKLKFLNHSSFLVTNEGGKSILTDPWFISTAFTSWYQNPYPDSGSVYDLTKSNKYIDDNLTVLISHGHDDHCDDFIIEHHFSDNKILVPKFATNGLQKRIKKNTGKFPLEVSNEPINIDGFTICNFINPNFTLYDAIQIIKFDDVAVIHANDNWHKYPDNLILEMNEFLDGIESEKIYYFV